MNKTQMLKLVGERTIMWQRILLLFNMLIMIAVLATVIFSAHLQIKTAVILGKISEQQARLTEFLDTPVVVYYTPPFSMPASISKPLYSRVD